jgi:rhodanese-related sulfurtransferase
MTHNHFLHPWTTLASRKGIAQSGSDIFAIMLLTAMLSWVYSGLSMPFTVDDVSLKTAQSWGDNALWLDARTRSDYQDEHIPGALSLHMDHWQEDIIAVQQQLYKKKIVVYCYSAACNSAALVAQRLRKEMGLKNVVIMHGGWETWEQERP